MDYRTWSLVREFALPLIEKGVPPFEVRRRVRQSLGFTIGTGKAGEDEDTPQCSYCGAYGGGAHGSNCPEGEQPE